MCGGPPTDWTDVIRLLLVDDHEIVRRGLRELLEANEDLRVIAEAGSLEEALALELDDIDVAVLDVRLPDGSGVDLCRLLHEKRADLACLMLTSFADNDELVKDLHKRFAFLGEAVAHFFLFGVGFNLPEQEKWAHAHFGERHHRG